LKHQCDELIFLRVFQNSAASAAASLKHVEIPRISRRISSKFRGICRGLIEAQQRPSTPGLGIENSAASAAASLKHFLEAGVGIEPAKFRGICRGLIEA